MLVLGIETSGRPGSVALCRNGRCLDERPLETAIAADGSPRPGLQSRRSSGPKRRHAQTLVAEVDGLFRRYGLSPRQCDLVAVSIGPGSFTGLRIGVVCAKTFAYAAGCRAAAVDTLQAIAENSPPDVNSLFIIANAQRGELFVGEYRRDANGRFIRQGEVAIVNAESWCRGRPSDDVVSGPAADKFEVELSGRCRVLDTPFRFARASVVARIGERQANAGDLADPWALEPLYLRKSAAQEKHDTTNQVGDGDAPSNTV